MARKNLEAGVWIIEQCGRVVDFRPRRYHPIIIASISLEGKSILGKSQNREACGRVKYLLTFAFEYSKNLIIAIGSRRSSSRKNIIENIESSKNHRRQPRHGSSNSLLRNLSTKEFKHYRTNSKLFHRVRINLIYWIYINRSHECNPASSLSKSLNQKLEWVLPSHLLFRRDRLRRTVFLGARNNPRPADFSRLIKPDVHGPWPGVGSLPPL